MDKQKLRIVVCGAAGRMGERIAALAQASPEIAVAGGVERSGHPAVGSALAGGGRIYGALADIIASCDVVIDFSAPAASMEHLASAAANGKALVIGTTGFDPAQTADIREASAAIPVVLSPNMSIGVNLLFKITSETARILKDYDAEIVELHHNLKKDAPSGTALKLGQLIAAARGKDLDAEGVYGRKGICGPRKKDELGILAVRAGDIVGEHTVYFAGTGERVELTHRAHSRDTLAAGALYAARWLANQKPGLYDMQDVLGFK